MKIVGTNFVRFAVRAGDTVRFKELAASGNLQAVNHLIGPAVIRTADFDDAFMLGCATCHADCRHNGFRARAEHTEHLASGHQFVYLFCKKKFAFVEKSRHGAAMIEQFEHLFSDGLEVAAQNGRTACLKEVDVLIAVTVVKIRAFRLVHAHRERIVESKVVLHSAGDVLLCFRRDLFGFGALCVKVVENIFQSVFRYAIYRLVGKVFQFLIDLLCVFPFGNAVAVCHNSPPYIVCYQTIQLLYHIKAQSKYQKRPRKPYKSTIMFNTNRKKTHLRARRLPFSNRTSVLQNQQVCA